MRRVSPYIDDLAKKLAIKGRNLIEKAYLEADYNKNKTQNLHDSYGSAVFYNGKLYPNSKMYFSKAATTSKYDPYQQEAITGRQAISEFFDDYKPKDKGMQLVVAVAIFYGGILELGGGNLRRKYKVISMIGDDIRALAQEVGKAKVSIIQNGKVNG